MKRSLLLILFIALSFSAYPQINNYTAVDGPYGGNLTKIIATANGSLLALGYAANIPKIYRSTDAGATWTVSTSGLPGQYIQDIYKDPSSDKIYAAASYAFNVSEDGGVTWTTLKPDLLLTVAKIAKSPVTQSLYLLTFQGKILKSTDGGVNWAELYSVDTSYSFYDFVIDGTGVMYIGTQGGGIYVADEAGNVQQKLPGTVHLSTKVVGSNVWTIGEEGPFVSSDHGTTWTSKKQDMTIEFDAHAMITSDASNNL